MRKHNRSNFHPQENATLCRAALYTTFPVSAKPNTMQKQARTIPCPSLPVDAQLFSQVGTYASETRTKSPRRNVLVRGSDSLSPSLDGPPSGLVGRGMVLEYPFVRSFVLPWCDFFLRKCFPGRPEFRSALPILVVSIARTQSNNQDANAKSLLANE